MIKLNEIPQYGAHHYAVVDLGSNSFHLSIVCLQQNKIIPVNKVKRKVRLASGLSEDNELSNEAIERGLDCLKLFAKHLATIPLSNICIVATATLRLAKNRNDFLNKANKILPVEIQLLSGKQEAETIYSGVAYTCNSDLTQERLVIDIGGASTELIIGKGSTANKAVSLDLGCVSFREKYFADKKLSSQNFTSAIKAACHIITPVRADFIALGWQSVVGSSGTIQALTEILSYRNQSIVITPDFLQEIKQALIECKSIDHVILEGLRADRTPVLASGLCILIALFDCLEIKELRLSTGALREGLLHKLLPI
ncbi:phosphatase [Colwellia sp. MSW7]|jgi:exopolyphosphatase/guanosine-5'-triphosphate,3'-diphosphate pyrophosphatase|uniref:Phosphatase n=1 Tax=Colwellia maritima TaxID=2912588 RepID=A0ABS9WZM5_9GAMM|nr:phosphatase [Colwellia maritima]MCI2282287.1 phosphatase [Colwellia maritima]